MGTRKNIEGTVLDFFQIGQKGRLVFDTAALREYEFPDHSGPVVVGTDEQVLAALALADSANWEFTQAFKQGIVLPQLGIDSAPVFFQTISGDAVLQAIPGKSGSELLINASGVTSTFGGGGLIISGGGVTADIGTFTTFSHVSNIGTAHDTAVSSPSNLTVSQNNWSGGIGARRTIRVSANAGLSITGLSIGQTAGQKVRLANVSSNAITLPHESGSSTDVNRFRCPGAANFSLLPDACVGWWYDGTSLRWRLER